MTSPPISSRMPYIMTLPKCDSSIQPPALLTRETLTALELNGCLSFDAPNGIMGSHVVHCQKPNENFKLIILACWQFTPMVYFPSGYISQSTIELVKTSFPALKSTFAPRQ